MTVCNMLWGSHGCHLESGHDGLHRCCCCDASADEHMAFHAAAEADEYGADGCAGQWPYYGRRNMTGEGALPFFTQARADLGWTLAVETDEFDRMNAIHEEATR